MRDVALGMPITADLSRSDIILLRPINSGQMQVVAQAQPHSISPLYDEDLVGQVLASADTAGILEAWRRRRRTRVARERGGIAPTVQDIWPVMDEAGRMIGLLALETSLIQLERHRQRHITFRRSVDWAKAMCANGELAATSNFSPFKEMDGVMLVDAQRRITYLSGIGNNLYRRLGYMEDLRGRRLSYLQTVDDEMALEALDTHTPIEREVVQGSHIWVRKVLPIWPPATVRGSFQRLFVGRGDAGGALILIHDATEEHRKRQELQVKTTMIQEVHHRVKNNLQTIAAVLRMQVRRAPAEATRQALNEAITRILSVAVIHEFLSLDERQAINVRDVCQRIVAQARQTLLPGKQIAFTIDGPAVYLPSQQATACALVVNELIQNALEHGYADRSSGTIQVGLNDLGDRIRLEICDDGQLLADDFDLASPTSLGLQIVSSLVTGDLHGDVTLANQERGVVATVTFPKVLLGKR